MKRKISLSLIAVLALAGLSFAADCQNGNCPNCPARPAAKMPVGPHAPQTAEPPCASCGCKGSCGNPACVCPRFPLAAALAARQPLHRLADAVGHLRHRLTHPFGGRFRR